MSSAKSHLLGPPLQRRRWRWGLFVGGWLLASAVLNLPLFVEVLAEGEAIPWSLVVSQFFGWCLWGLFVPGIWWAVRRFPIERRHWRRRLFLHLGLAGLVTVVYGFLAMVKSQVVSEVAIAFAAGESAWAAVGTALNPAMLRGFPLWFLSAVQLHFLVYLTIAAAIHAFLYYDQYRARASRLETQLAQAQLKMLKMQLHPHFLFNTLNAISALMHRDVEAADKMIALLSDLLRLSLEKDDRHQVPLQKEVEYLHRYLAIEQIRFRDRLSVDIDVADECLRAQVPKLVLQPLVENSIRHGIAMRSAAGKVAVRARRRGDRLDVQVTDDGPGLPAGGRALREGVGLANTRARLEQLYGEDHRFELRNGRFGGFEVSLEIPFEERSRFGLRGAA